MSRRWISRDDIAEELEATEIATDPERLIRKFLPYLRGYVTNNFQWMDRRGNCVLSIDDLIQVGSIRMMKLADRWAEIVGEHPEFELEGGTYDRVFWAYLRRDVQTKLTNEYNKERRASLESLTFEIDGEELERPSLYDYTDGEMHDRTGVRRRPDGTWWPAVFDNIMSFWDRMPPKDKLLIALRYYDELPRDRVVDLTGSSSIAMVAAVRRWRAHARNQVVVGDTCEPIEKINHRPWEPPELLTTYLRNRHNMDLHEYLGIVTISFRADSDYVARALDVAPFRAPGSNDQITSEQLTTMDRMYAEGYNYAEIGRAVGVSRGSIGLRLDAENRANVRARRTV